MNPEFTPSKTVRDIIQFDKEHRQLRFLMDEEQVIPYREISSCSLKNQYYKKSSVSQLANLFTNNGILASEKDVYKRQYVRRPDKSTLSGKGTG